MKQEEFEIELRKLEIRYKELEIEKIQKESKNKEKLINPVTVTIIVALLGLFFTFYINSLQKSSALAIEKQKFQFEIYSKAQLAETPKKAAQIIDFYIKAKLIPGKEGEFTKLIKEGKTDKVPVFESYTAALYRTYGDIQLPAKSYEEITVEGDFIVGNNVSQKLSPNTSGKFKNGFPDAIVFGYTGGRSHESSVGYLIKPNVKSSAHFVIGRNGEITQLIPLNYIAWGIGRSEFDGRSGWNKYSIYIELDNAGSLEKVGNQYKSWFRKPYNENEVVQAEHKHGGQYKYWHKYTDAQLKNVEQLCNLLMEKYNIKYILGKDDLAPGRKLGPGPAFPLERYQKMLDEKK